MTTNVKKLKVLKYMCEDSLLFYARYIYKENHNRKFIQSKHFEIIAEYLEKVYRLETTRLIINIPPRYGKTELVIKIFVSWCLAKVNYAKFIHLSYSDSLALDNSSQTKEYIQSEAYQRLWKMELKKDAQSKKKWFNEFGGGMYATASGGAITGFGAGVDGVDGFGGAILIDDPLKPDDAFSEVERNKVNQRYNNTIRSRTNTDNTPIIVIMQRLHEDDLSGYLLGGGSGETWEHLCLPALNENNEPLFPHKHTFEQLESIRQADRYTFAGQYMQKPAPDEGGEWRRDWFNIIDKKDLPKGIRWTMYIDGAYTKDTKNDPTGIQVSARSGNDLYIYSSIDKYLEMPELIKYIDSHIIALDLDIQMIKVEPKASGKSLVQLIRDTTKYNISEIKSNFVKVSKIERARTSSPYIEGGRVHLVKGNWNEPFLHQISLFPNGKHDEHIDLTAYAIEDHLLINSDLYNHKLRW
jgi:predicted phage terminase large subunit-like protein